MFVNFKNKKKRGISLIVLVITIIIIIIIAGAIILSLSDNNIINNALTAYSENLESEVKQAFIQGKLNEMLGSQTLTFEKLEQNLGLTEGTLAEKGYSIDELGNLCLNNEVISNGTIPSGSIINETQPEPPPIITKETSSDASLYKTGTIDYSFLVDGKEFFLGYSSYFPAWFLGTIEPLETGYTVTFSMNANNTSYNSYNRIWGTCNKQYKFRVYCTQNYNGLGLVPNNTVWYYYTNEFIVNANTLQNIMYHTSTIMSLAQIYCTSDVYWTQLNTTTLTANLAKAANMKIYKSVQ
jgi:hypothetical protein